MTEDHPNHSFRVDGHRVQCVGCTAYFMTNVKERILMDIPVPVLCRLEHYTPTGWVVANPAVNLLYPARYPERLEDQNKYGRAVELDDRLQPTGVKWEPRRLPKRSALVPTDTQAYGLPDPERRGTCQWCERYHGDPFDGSCLL